MALAKRALVVLGAHRSGTSAITQVLALSGFILPRNMLPAQPDNPSGFWESQVIVGLNDEILAMRDSSWHDAFPPDDAPLLSNSGAVCLARAESAISSEFQGASPIVLKDPRISVLTSFWKRALEQQGYESDFIIMVRNPIEVAASLAKRNGFSHERGLLLWLTHMIAAERKTRGDRRIFVLYERLLNDVYGIQNDIEGMTGEPLPRRTRAAGLEIQRAINAELRHHRAVGPIMVRNELESLAKDTYDWLTSSARGEALDTAIPDQIAARLRACEEVAGGVMAELQSEGRQLALSLQAELTNSQNSLQSEQEKSKALDQSLENAKSEASGLALAVQTGQAEIASIRAALEEGQIRSAAIQLDLSNVSTLLHVEQLKSVEMTRLLESKTINEENLTLALEASQTALSQAQTALEGEADNNARILTEERRNFEALTLALEASQTALSQAQTALEGEADNNARIMTEERRNFEALTLALEASQTALSQAQTALEGETDNNARILTEERRNFEALTLALNELRLEISAKEKQWDQLKNVQSTHAEENRAQILKEWALERTTLVDLAQAQRTKAVELRTQVDELTETLSYIQSRPWWRALSRVKRLIN